MTGWGIRQAQAGDCEVLARMRAELWPESSAAEHTQELQMILAGQAGAAGVLVFVWESEDGTLAGFVETRLRSHADGCDESQAVGYVEGWFVAQEKRRQGIGAALLKAAEDWARAQGCKEMASDAETHNEVSQRAHEALGFAAVSRVISYRKEL